ncbi:Excinuclease ABC C subunit domain protein [Croceitalea dokdonensis DOKDO 023]|uniref:Excinuclease ABC C subunit domain protein n=1 Tax=Croceitalea dokdonensis DOKDO 023 TaxID=1300341 RepID=A0A0P7AG24_9FLAO|nr:GIY-YIG nuclease family protein [Croceitalea dokdonensis]KPM32352.1 Excinuclease ABC C subunit domain protein [Croceitalea dokdonensis DOKDO 023]
MIYYFYALKSTVDGRIYKGISKDVAQRLKWHNEGKTKSTKGYRPWVFGVSRIGWRLRKSKEKGKILQIWNRKG